MPNFRPYPAQSQGLPPTLMRLRNVANEIVSQDIADTDALLRRSGLSRPPTSAEAKAAADYSIEGGQPPPFGEARKRLDMGLMGQMLDVTPVAPAMKLGAAALKAPAALATLLPMGAVGAPIARAKAAVAWLKSIGKTPDSIAKDTSIIDDFPIHDSLWNKFGLAVNREGEFMWHISDLPAKINPKALKYFNREGKWTGRLKDFYEHPELAEAMPGVIGAQRLAAKRAPFSEGTKTLAGSASESYKITAPGEQALLRSLPHEVGHTVSNRARWALGGSPNSISAPEARMAEEFIRRFPSGKSVEGQAYHNLVDEVRQRANQRMLDAERQGEKLRAPIHYEDVPRDFQILRRSFPGIGVEKAVKAPGGMWHPEAVERLADPLTRSGGFNKALWAIPVGGDAALAAKNVIIEANRTWPHRSVRNYLNKHAGTEGDPLKNIDIPFGTGMKKWGEVIDAAIRGDKFHGRGSVGIGDTQLPVRPGETVWGLPTRRNPSGISNSALVERDNQQALESYLSHVGDYLRQNVKPEKLAQYDLVRAVRETAANDLRVAKEMEKAATASMKDMPVYKEYPDGFKWIELKMPERLTEGQLKTVRKMTKDDGLGKFGDSSTAPYLALDSNGKPIKDLYSGHYAIGHTAEEAWTAGRLSEEGNQMGHCVGGYCDEVVRGDSRIFSLRDSKGKSHVTVEVEPSRGLRAQDVYRELTDVEKAKVDKAMTDLGVLEGGGLGGEDLIAAIRETVPEAYTRVYKNSPQNISQIQGKQNRTPDKVYNPYIEDFVKSGSWHGKKEWLDGIRGYE